MKHAEICRENVVAYIRNNGEINEQCIFEELEGSLFKWGDIANALDVLEQKRVIVRDEMDNWKVVF